MNTKKFQSGYICLMGTPNAGKSTLLNKILGQKIASVSFQPQTTRQQQLGILTTEDYQMIFIDTPGYHKPKHKLGRFMNINALEALKDADVVLYVMDASNFPINEENVGLVDQIVEAKLTSKIILVLNKVDKIPADERDERVVYYQEVIPHDAMVQIAALIGTGVPELLAEILEYLPEGPLYFPEDQVTDLYIKDICADLIRESCLKILRDEVPHSVAIRMDEYTEKEEKIIYIRSTIFVERESQKGIVIGRNGKMIKQIGSLAHKQIEDVTEQHVYLDLNVKVHKNWRNNEGILAKFGY